MPAALRPLGADRADSVRAAARVPRAAAQRVPPRVRCALATLQTPGMEHEACADALPARDGAIWCRAAAKFAQKLRTHTHPRAHAHDLSDTDRGKLSTAPACTTEPRACRATLNAAPSALLHGRLSVAGHLHVCARAHARARTLVSRTFGVYGMKRGVGPPCWELGGGGSARGSRFRVAPRAAPRATPSALPRACYIYMYRKRERDHPHAGVRRAGLAGVRQAGLRGCKRVATQ